MSKIMCHCGVVDLGGWKMDRYHFAGDGKLHTTGSCEPAPLPDMNWQRQAELGTWDLSTLQADYRIRMLRERLRILTARDVKP